MRLFALLALASAPSLAQESLVGDVSVLIDSPWPATIERGYFPVWVALRNEAPEPRTVDLHMQAMGWRSARRDVRMRVALEGGEQREVELFAPAFSSLGGSSGATFSAAVEVGRERRVFGLGTASGGAVPGTLHVLVATPVKLPAGTPDQIGQRLLDTPAVSALIPASGSSITGPRGRVVVHSGAGTQVMPVTVVQHERLPTRPAAYTSLDLVVLDARRGLPDRERLAALLAWVQLGGKLIVYGPDALAGLGTHAVVGPLLEDRFQTSAGSESGRAFHVGLGRLLVDRGADADADLLAEPAHVAAAADLLVTDARQGFVPSFAGWRFSSSRLVIPGLGELPLRVFLALLFAFALVIGPLNLILIKRLARPALLLVTIPAISVVTSIGILAYGILYQGVDVKAAQQSLTVLDQRTHRAASLERRAMFVGLSPGTGLRPKPGTIVLPTRLEDDTERYAVDFGSGVLLSGTFLPVRDPVEHMVLREGPARSRLAVELEEGRVRVQNTFDVTLQSVAVRTPDGSVHARTDALAPGDSAVLEPWNGTFSELHARIGGGLELFRDVRLERSSYVARLSASPFTDDCGLELNVKSANHLVHGILAADAREW